MGMFDEIIYKGETYQTKSLDCELKQYRITDDGRLVLNEDGTERRETIYFYGEENGKHVDYYAVFLGGRLIDIRREERDEESL